MNPLLIAWGYLRGHLNDVEEAVWREWLEERKS